MPYRDKGEAAFYRESPTLVPDWSTFMQMRNPNLYSLIGPNSTKLVGFIRSELSGVLDFNLLVIWIGHLTNVGLIFLVTTEGPDWLFSNLAIPRELLFFNTEFTELHSKHIETDFGSGSQVSGDLDNVR